jgi:hypothetical protein
MSEKTYRYDHPDVLRLNALKMVMTSSIQLHNQRLLEVVLAEALNVGPLREMGGIKGVRALEIQPHSKRFVFMFLGFVSYAVTEEMFSQGSDIDVVADANYGRVRQLTQSPFLNFVRASTWAEDYYQNDPLLHFQLITLDHTVDVVTTLPPEVYSPNPF